MEARIVTSGPDLEEVRGLFREYAEWVAVDLSFQRFSEELASLPADYVAPGGTLLLGVVDARVAGCVAVHEWQPAVCELKRLYVRPTFQGFGCGLFLARRAISWATDAGYGRIVLDTLPEMGAAQHLYERLGFRDIAPYRLNPVPGARFMGLELDAGSLGQRPRRPRR
jgi:putative acetyltransferase